MPRLGTNNKLSCLPVQVSEFIINKKHEKCRVDILKLTRENSSNHESNLTLFFSLDTFNTCKIIAQVEKNAMAHLQLLILYHFLTSTPTILPASILNNKLVCRIKMRKIESCCQLIIIIASCASKCGIHAKV